MTNTTEHPTAPEQPAEVGQVQRPVRPDVERVMRAVWDLVRSGPNYDGRQHNVEAAIAAAIDRAVAADGEKMRSALERIGAWADAYQVEVFPEPLRLEWQRANEVLAQAGLSMTRMSASNLRHVISGVRKLVDEGLKA